MLTDLRYALRGLCLTPGFTAVALVVLTLGIGATTAVFSVVDAVVLRGLPFDQASRLIEVRETSLSGRDFGNSVAPQNFLEWRATHGGVFEDLAAVAGGALTLRDGATPESFQVVRVSSSLFGLLRAEPHVGRLFTADNEINGNHRVVLISDGLWRRRFGADPNIAGRTIEATDGVWQIAGVMPAGFTFPIGLQKPIELWTPLVLQAAERERGNNRTYFLRVVGRLNAGVPIERARARMEQVTASLAAQYPKWFEDRAVGVVSLQDALVGKVRDPMVMLLVAVTIVLLIACVNVANLMLARSTARVREVGIRAAVGASRWQVMRGVLAESLVLSVIGTACGMLLAWWSVRTMVVLLPPTLPRLGSIAINTRVLIAAIGAALTTAIFFGLTPAWRLSRTDLVKVLSQSGPGAMGGPDRRGLRSVFLIAEVALAVVLVVAATLSTASFARVMRVELGMDYRQLSSVRISAKVDLSVKERADQERARGAALVQAVRERLQRMPGVESTALMSTGAALLVEASASTNIEVPGRPELRSPHNRSEIKFVSEDYFRTMGIPVLRGREFHAEDMVVGSDAVIFNEVAARLFLGDGDPVGQPVLAAGPRTVVGVVRGVRLQGPEKNVVPEVYRPLVTRTTTGGTLFVRSAPNAGVSVEAIRKAIQEMGTGIQVSDPQTLTTLFDRVLQPRTLSTTLVGIFGLLAIVIAATGIYGVMAYVVAQRAREIGVRMALGARPSQVQRTVMMEAAWMLGFGVVIGTGGALLLSRSVKSFLFEVDARDPALYALAVTVLVVVGLVAALVPARRASKVDPMVTLRA